MIYINEKFFTETKNDKYVIHDNKIYRQTNISKSLQTRYELVNNL